MSENQYSAEAELVKRITGAEQIKETHISYALLTDDYVYKIKKPVDFGFLDYRLLKSRRSYCILEKELNDRFSKDVYLEVLKVVHQSKEKFALVPVENSLPAIEYVLKMKRIKDSDFLASRISAGNIDCSQMVNIGAQVANLLINLENAPKDEDFKEPYDSVRFNAVENFNQTEKYKNIFIDSASFEFIKNKTLNFLEDNRELFNSRAVQGFIKNGHGDLRLDHIYFNADGTVGLIDCIEFNRRFRYIDVIAEAAFLSMELDMSGKTDFSDCFIEGFLSVFSDENTVKLLNYYRSYLAYVRAKVTCFLVDGKDKEWELYSVMTEEISRLIDLSAYYALNMESIITPVFYGLMGTGKSKNAKMFSARFPVSHINSDEVRKKDAGVASTEKLYNKFDEGVYSHENSIKVYEKMANITLEKGRLGRSCVIDASFTKESYLNTFISVGIENLRFYQFTAPEEIILSRLNGRLSKDVVSDGRPEIYFAQKESAKMPKPDFVIVTTQSVSKNVEKIFKTLIK